MTHTIIITPARDNDNKPRHNSRGPLFDVWHQGQIIVSASHEPCLEGARALKAMGFAGKLELWDDVTPYVRLTADIDKAAKLTVREGDRLPAFEKFKSFSQRLAQDGDLGPGGTQMASGAKSPPTDSPPAFAELSIGGAA